MSSNNKSFAEKLQERMQRGWERGQQQNAEKAKAQQTTRSQPAHKTDEWENMSLADTYRAMGSALVRSVPSMTKGVVQAHGIDSKGAPSPSYGDYDSTANTENTRTTDHSSSHKPQFGEDGYGGRYPQGVNTTDAQPTAQSSTGQPYEVNRPEVKVDPKDIKWPPSSFR